MDTNLILIWVVGLNCGLGLVKLGRQRGGATRGWFRVYAALFAVLVILFVLAPERAGLIAGLLWAVFALLPSLGAFLVVQSLHWGWFGLSAFTARTIAILHPMDGWGEYPSFVRLYRALHTGDAEEAAGLVRRICERKTPFANAAVVMAVGLTGDWAGFRAWIESLSNRDAVLRDASALNGYLTALGRLGAYEEMFRVYQQYGDPMVQRSGGTVAALVRMSIAVQTGSVAMLRRLLEGPLGSLPAAARAFHTGVAEQVAGHPDRAEVHFRAVLEDESSGETLKARSRRHIASPLSPFPREKLSDGGRSLLESMENEIQHESQYAVASGKRSRPIATWAIAAILLVVFGFELPGGATDYENLTDLGAMIVTLEGSPARAAFEAVEEQWWRPITAGFLHFGYLHVFLNLFGLLLLGNWLERAWGHGRLVLVYAVALVASTGLFPYFVTLTPGDPLRMLVGASGGVLGLLGALLARTIVGRLRGNSRLVRRQLSSLAMIAALQLVFDQSVPQVSSICHAIGMVTGFAVGLVLATREKQTG